MKKLTVEDFIKVVNDYTEEDIKRMKKELNKWEAFYDIYMVLPHGEKILEFKNVMAKDVEKKLNELLLLDKNFKINNWSYLVERVKGS